MIYDDLKEIDSEPVQEAEWQGEKENWIFNKGVIVEHVTYHYPDSDVEVLHDISMEIPKGKTVALIGPSGAGKNNTGGYYSRSASAEHQVSCGWISIIFMKI